MIHIACNIDHNYVQHCAVTLVSLFINNPEETFTVHIVAGELSDADKALLSGLADTYGSIVCYYAPNQLAGRFYQYESSASVYQWQPITVVSCPSCCPTL